MSPADQIRELSARIHLEMDRAFDYHRLTRAVWALARHLTGRGAKLTFLAPDGTKDDLSQDIATRGREYTTTYLPESVFQRSIALFEDYISSLITIWLTAHPRGLRGLTDDRDDDRAAKSDRMVPLDWILENPDRDSILLEIIGRELDRLTYRRLSAWFKYLDDRVKLGCPTKEEVDELAEMKASRDLLVHNRGVANRTYLEKAGSKARYAEGQRIEIPDPYLVACRNLILKVVDDTSSAALAKIE